MTPQYIQEQALSHTGAIHYYAPQEARSMLDCLPWHFENRQPFISLPGYPHVGVGRCDLYGQVHSHHYDTPLAGYRDRCHYGAVLLRYRDGRIGLCAIDSLSDG